MPAAIAIPPTVAGQNVPAEKKPNEDRSQEAKQAPGRGEGDNPQQDPAGRGEGGPGGPTRRTADRVKRVRQMYAKVPCEILGFVEPAKRIVGTQNDGRSVMLLLEDANDKKLAIHLLPKLGKTPDSFLLMAGQLPPHGRVMHVEQILQALVPQSSGARGQAIGRVGSSPIVQLDDHLVGAIALAARGRGRAGRRFREAQRGGVYRGGFQTRPGTVCVVSLHTGIMDGERPQELCLTQWRRPA